MSSDQFLVSVIVPAYNSSKTIERCLNSLLNQTIPVEIIVVDDGSTDGTGAICERYYNTHSNIRILKQKNSGVSSARNAGLKMACGKYVGFVDSDDYVSPLMFEKLAKALEYDDSLSISIVCQDISGSDGISQIKSHREIVRDILCSSNVRGYPWNKLFRKKIIESTGLFFSTDLHVMEDKLFCLQYMNVANGGGIELYESLYFYDMHQGSHTIDRYGLVRYMTGLDACEAILQLPCIRKDKEFTDIQQAITVKHCVQIARESVRLNEDITRYQQRIRGFTMLTLFSRYLTVKQKVGYFVLKFCPWLLKKI